MYLIIWELEFLQHSGTNSGLRSWTASYQGAKESKATPLEVAGRHTTSVTADIGYLEDHQNAFV